MDIKIIKADLSNPKHARDIVYLSDLYARDPMGAGEPLPEKVKAELIERLREMPTTLIFLAYDSGQNPVGAANCFIGFSTFYAKKLINIHDLTVIPRARGEGIGRALIKRVTQEAETMNCCKVTLEVREDNPARRLYERSGFSYGDPTMLFMTKEIVKN